MEFMLNTGKTIPALGLGTWQLREEKVLLNALSAAFEAGYRHIDTARIYENEEIIGKFLKTKPRDKIFLTTKLWNTDHDRVEEACRESMERLGVEYLDLYLVHWPVNFNGAFDLRKLWPQMEALVDSGKVRAIGVSNFGIKNLELLLEFCRIKPAVNQIELHPYLPQDNIRALCKKNRIQIVSYSSLGSSAANLRDDPVIKRIAEARSVSISTVLLSFGVSLGCCVIPRSSSPAHIRENGNILQLSSEELDEISGITTRKRFVDPESFGPHRFD